jgi:hypothetical protein
VTGSWFHGRRHGSATIHFPVKGIERLEGEWVGGRLHGWTKYTDGSVAQGWVKEGAWHGVYRKLTSDGDLSTYGRCRSGQLYGWCWKGLLGGGALYGPADWNGALSGQEVVYLYPCFTIGLKGSFTSKEKLIWAHRVDVIRAACNRGELKMEVCAPANAGKIFRPSFDIVTQQKHLRDPYEQKTVSCKKSRVGHGEGLFMKRSVAAGLALAKTGSICQRSCELLRTIRQPSHIRCNTASNRIVNCGRPNILSMASCPVSAGPLLTFREELR